jgi:hypothetical protein
VKEARKCNNAGIDNNKGKGEENSPHGRRTIIMTVSERQKKDKDTKEADSKINK